MATLRPNRFRPGPGHRAYASGTVRLAAATIALAVAAGATAQSADPLPLAAAADAAPAPIVRYHVVPATPVAAATTAQPLICRSTLATGSLIARHKQCLTKAQWRYVDDQHEAEARRLMIDNMGRPSCNDAATC